MVDPVASWQESVGFEFEDQLGLFFVEFAVLPRACMAFPEVQKPAN